MPHDGDDPQRAATKTLSDLVVVEIRVEELVELVLLDGPLLGRLIDVRDLHLHGGSRWRCCCVCRMETSRA